MLKALYVWNEGGMKFIFRFYVKVEECPMDKVLIFAKYKAKMKQVQKIGEMYHGLVLGKSLNRNYNIRLPLLDGYNIGIFYNTKSPFLLFSIGS